MVYISEEKCAGCGVCLAICSANAIALFDGKAKIDTRKCTDCGQCISVYVPVSFPDNFKKKVESYGAKLVEVSEQREIYKDVFSTGELGVSIKEQSLVLKTKEGLVIITGCAHPGIVNIVRSAKENISRNIYLVLGGFHLLSYSPRGIKEILLAFKELGVEKVGPSHCSGDTAKRLFRKEYGENFEEMGAGKVIEIK